MLGGAWKMIRTAQTVIGLRVAKLLAFRIISHALSMLVVVTAQKKEKQRAPNYLS